MELIAVLEAEPALWLTTTLILGLLVGSFLNVVILRLPPMLEYRWRENCREFLQQPASDNAPPPGLVSPRSCCPNCGHSIGALENVPVLSYIALQGKCKGCHAPISIRYPAIELLTGGISLLVAWHFGVSWEAIGALGLSWALIALSFIDIDHQLLPDSITLPGIWAGLLFSLFAKLSDPISSILGAVLGYLALWSVYQLFRLLTGKEGMGYGDFKLLAMIGAWTGWQALPGTILLSSLVGALLGGTMLLVGDREREHPIPFGPYLAVAGWLMLVWGEHINTGYLRFAGLA